MAMDESKIATWKARVKSLQSTVAEWKANAGNYAKELVTAQQQNRLLTTQLDQAQADLMVARADLKSEKEAVKTVTVGAAEIARKLGQLMTFVMTEMPNELQEGEGSVDCVIRVIRSLRSVPPVEKEAVDAGYAARRG